MKDLIKNYQDAKNALASATNLKEAEVKLQEAEKAIMDFDTTAEAASEEEKG